MMPAACGASLRVHGVLLERGRLVGLSPGWGLDIWRLGDDEVHRRQAGGRLVRRQSRRGRRRRRRRHHRNRLRVRRRNLHGLRSWHHERARHHRGQRARRESCALGHRGRWHLGVVRERRAGEGHVRAAALRPVERACVQGGVRACLHDRVAPQDLAWDDGHRAGRVGALVGQLQGPTLRRDGDQDVQAVAAGLQHGLVRAKAHPAPQLRQVRLPIEVRIFRLGAPRRAEGAVRAVGAVHGEGAVDHAGAADEPGHDETARRWRTGDHGLWRWSEGWTRRRSFRDKGGTCMPTAARPRLQKRHGRGSRRHRHGCARRWRWR
mmetsp:Transcript_35424/g.102019  ORF Transcript_35424/g.102019 Transcript_35424/m.102019 type:complete len:321 (-) Transcript_35424:1036-1998(-)